MQLYNDDTHPSGHMSGPTHVDFSHSRFQSLNKLIKSEYTVWDKNPASGRNSYKQRIDAT